MRARPNLTTISLVRRASLLAWSVLVVSHPALAGTTESATTHWSLRPLTRPGVPGDEANPIDAFVRARLTGAKLAPSPRADRRTLLRRLSFDLTGLPPTPGELEAFLSDDEDGAWERIVERLLTSPRHGEHLARHWLDVASYADTHGNDHDYARPHAWPYRDWVIRAFNDDKPYARFVEEQVAGDALFPDDPDATLALGFIAAGPWDHTLMVTVREDTVDHRSAQNLDRDAMVAAVMGSFVSLTVSCARCHDHKFDPITQREYYELQAVFAGVDRADRPVDIDPLVHAERRRRLAAASAIARRDTSWLATLESADVARRVAAWESDRARQEGAWEPLEILSVVSTGGSTITREADGSWFVSGARPERDDYIVTARRPAGKLSAVRLETLPDDRLPERGPGRWDNGNFHLSELRIFAAPPDAELGSTPLAIARATADYNEGPKISAAEAIDGVATTPWGVHPRYGEPHTAVFEFASPGIFPDRTTFTILLEHQDGVPGHGIGRFRLSASDEPPLPSALDPISPELAAILRVPRDERTPAERERLLFAVLAIENARALARLPAPQLVYAVTNEFPADGPNFTPSPRPRPIHLLARGDLSQPGELVAPGTLACVPGLASRLEIRNADEESERRAALARWITDERNVLTWRSIVNRVWSWHFGRGLCETPNDLGVMGGTPSHPELLDWLAVWFRDEARGSLRALHRLIVTSETWRQTSLAHHGAGVDPENRLLWRQHRRRLSAEAIRDTILALGDRLDRTMGGPPAVQFLSRGDATFQPGGNPPFLDYEHFDPELPAARRRAIHRFLFRTVPDPLMDALGCPDGSQSTPDRHVSTTALEALAMLNDAFVIRQSEHIAARVARSTDDPSAQATLAFRSVLLRDPIESERQRFAGYIERHGLANACHLLLNTNEFVYLD